MISGFVDPPEPLFMDLNIPDYFQKSKTFQEGISEHNRFLKTWNWETEIVNMLERTENIIMEVMFEWARSNLQSRSC